MKVFLFDNANNKVIINEPEVLLIKEFAALWTNERNKTKEDPKGIYKSRAYRELTYIWLMIDWAPGCLENHSVGCTSLFVCQRFDRADSWRNGQL